MVTIEPWRKIIRHQIVRRKQSRYVIDVHDRVSESYSWCHILEKKQGGQKSAVHMAVHAEREGCG